MITSITILTTTLIIALGLSIVSATLQVIGYDNNIKPETDNMLNKLSLTLNTLAMIIISIGFLSVIMGW
jgi:Na+/melibiose symporter-like transporter